MNSGAHHSGLNLQPTPNNRWVMFVCFVGALLLAVFPIAPELLWLRPQFTLLLVIYWCLMLPQAISLPLVLMMGLLEDVVSLSVLGQHGLASVIVAYVCLLCYQRLRFRSAWQQSCWVFVFVGLQQVLMNWVHGLGGSVAQPSHFLITAFTSALAWPILFGVMEKVRYYCRIG